MWSPDLVRVEGSLGSGPGRFITAAVDLEPGTVVLSESPFLWAPKQSSCLVCVECCAVLNSLTTCTSCGLPLCTACAGREALPRHGAECQLLASNSVKFSFASEDEAVKAYCLVSPLRLLVGPSAWRQALETHAGAREGTPVWIFNSKYVVPLLSRLKRGDAAAFTADEIHEATGALDTNTFEVKTLDSAGEVASIGRALYLQAALLNNNCQPNLTRAFITAEEALPARGDTVVTRPRATFTTGRRVPAGQELTVSYVGALQPTATRQAVFSQTKHFTCTCARCRDPSELGSHLGSILCECGGPVVPGGPCQACGAALPEGRQDQVEEMVRNLASRLEPAMECIVWRSALGKVRRLLTRDHHLLSLAKRKFLLHADRCESCRAGEEAATCRAELRRLEELLELGGDTTTA